LRTGGGFFSHGKVIAVRKKSKKSSSCTQKLYTEQNYLWVLAVVFWSLPFLSGRGGQMLIVLGQWFVVQLQVLITVAGSFIFLLLLL
jgi:hypothetical protein